MTNTKKERLFKELRAEKKVNLPGLCPEEIELLYTTALSLKAKRIFDLGVAFGFSTRVLLLVAEETNGHVWSVDIKECHQAKRKIKELKLEKYWSFIQMDDLGFLKGWKTGEVDLIFIDTSHRHTLEELKACSRILRKGGIIFVHDFFGDQLLRKPGKRIRISKPVKKAIEEFIEKNPNDWSFKVFKMGAGLGQLTKK